MRAEIIAVGSELLTPFRSETNSLFITAQLNRLGFVVYRKQVVGDRPAEIRQALEQALQDSDVIVFSGGLGPTTDDITRETVAGVLGRSLSQDPAALNDLAARYRRFGVRMSSNNLRQALVPEGAQVLENPEGTAPGLFLREGNSLIFLLPGPPHELEPMLKNKVLPLIRCWKPVVRRFDRKLKVAGMGESSVDARIQSIYQNYPQVETTILSSPGIISLWFAWQGDPQDESAEKTLNELVGKVRDELGVAVFSDCDEDLPEVAGRLLKLREMTVAVAESCTGGLIGKMFSDIPGSSEYFLGGVICYSNRVKVELLGVEQQTLAEHGAVSEAVARQMAAGVRSRCGADVGISVTGIAGPSGGSQEKPVGLVFLGLAGLAGTEVKRLQFPGNREIIRLRTARSALDLLRRRLL